MEQALAAETWKAERYEISVLFGPCSRPTAERLLDRVAENVTGCCGAVTSMSVYHGPDGEGGAE